MPGTVIIGAVAVRVRPDTKNFRRELKQDLDAIEKGLPTLVVPLELDGEEAVAHAQAVSRELEAEFKDQRVEVQVDVKTDSSAAQRLIAEINSLTKKHYVEVKPKVDPKSWTEIRNDVKQITSTLKDRFLIKTHIDGGALERELRQSLDHIRLMADEVTVRLKTESDPAQIAQLENFLGNLKAMAQDINVKLDVQTNRLSYAKAWTELKKLAKPEVKEIFVKVNKAAATSVGTALSRITGLRMLWELHKEKFEAMANFDILALKIGKVSASMALMSSAMASAGANVLSVSKGLIQIGALAYALPGVLAGVGASFYVLKTAFADFNKVLPGFKQSWDEMKSKMTENFWGKALAPMHDMIDNVFPKFSKGMQSLGTSTGQWAAGMSEGFKKAFGGNYMTTNFDLINKSVANLSKSTGALTNALATWVNFGLKQFPAISNKISEMTIRFDAWTTRVASDGSLQKWYDDGVKNFSSLLGVIKNLTVSFWNLMNIAQSAGAATLQSLEQSTAKMAAVTANANFAQRLQDTLTAVMGLVDAIGVAIEQNIARLASAISGTLIMGFNHLAPAIGGLISSLMQGLSTPEFQRGLLAIFDAITVAAKAFAPMMGILAEKIGLVGQGAGEVIKQLAPLFAEFIGEAAGFLTTVMPAFITSLQIIGPAMQKVFESLSPIWQMLGQVVADLLTTMAPVIATLAQGLAPILQQVGSIIANVLLTAIQQLAPIMPLIAQAFLDVVKALAPLADQIGVALIQLIQAIVPVLPALLPLIVQLVQLLAPMIAALLPVLVDLVRQLVPIIIQVVKWIGQMVTTLTPAIQTMFPILVTVFSFIASFVIDTIKHVINGVQNFVEGIISVVKGIIDFFVGVFTGDWSRAWEGIKEIFSGVWQAIIGILEVYVFGGLLKGLGAIGSMLKGGFTAVWAAVKGIFGDGIGGVVKLVLELPSKLYGFFSETLPGFFKGGGMDAMRGMINGVKAKAGELVDFIRGVCGDALDAIKSFFHIQSPSRVMRQMGGFIMEGLYLGIKDNGQDVVDMVKNVAKDIRAVDFSLSSVDTSALDKIDLPGSSLNVAAQNDGAYNSLMRDVNININGTEAMSANDIAGEVMFALNRAQFGGVYGSRL